jgi:hypothetical protein
MQKPREWLNLFCHGDMQFGRRATPASAPSASTSPYDFGSARKWVRVLVRGAWRTVPFATVRGSITVSGCLIAVKATDGANLAVRKGGVFCCRRFCRF